MRFSSLTLEQQDEERGEQQDEQPDEQPDDQQDDRQDEKETAGSSLNLGMILDESQLDDGPRLSALFADEDEAQRPENDASLLSEDPIESYGLRKNINRQCVASTHIDVDQSGNYDPEEEARDKLAKARLAKKVKQAQRNKKVAKKKPRDTEREFKPTFIFKYKIKNMGTLRNITDDQDNWPDGHSIVDSEDETEIQDPFRMNTPTPTHNLHIPDPAGMYEDLTGHPAVRGCKTCRTDGLNCSMVADGEYPCQDCLNKQADCEPLIDLGVLGPCNRCVEQGQSCSFEDSNEEP